jgi:DNA topoisomerase-1
MTGNEKPKLLPTDVGIVVNDFLMEYFPGIMDYHFTASVEKEFDEVADGEKEWTGMMDAFYQDFHPLVEKTSNTKTEHKVGERILGTDPVSGKPVSVKIGRYGPIIQIGSVEDEEKPKFAQLPKGMALETITLEEALECFKLPRTLGDFEEKTVTVGVGRFGPYVRHNNAFVSIPKGTDPMSITLEDAIALIQGKREAAENKVIKIFEDEPGLQILNGRYGPYIAFEKKNYKIPENVEPKDLSKDACFKVIELQKMKGETKKPRYSKKK